MQFEVHTHAEFVGPRVFRLYVTTETEVGSAKLTDLSVYNMTVHGHVCGGNAVISLESDEHTGDELLVIFAEYLAEKVSATGDWEVYNGPELREHRAVIRYRMV